MVCSPKSVDLILGLVLAAPGTSPAQVTRVDFEAPSLGAAQRAIVDPYETDGVVFTVDAPRADEVVGLVRNQATSVCVGPSNGNQKLGTGRSAFGPDGSIGLSGYHIRATFDEPLAPVRATVFVQVEFQAVPYTGLRLRLHDASGRVVAAADVVAAPESDIPCPFPGEPRARRTVTATSSQTVAYAVMGVAPVDYVYVLDDFTFGQTPVGIEQWTWGGIKAIYQR